MKTLKTNKLLNYTIIFTDGGFSRTITIYGQEDIILAIKKACEKAELSELYITSIQAA